MYGPTAEKGYCRRPDLTRGTSRVVLLGLSRVDCVAGPDVRTFRDHEAPPPKARPAVKLAPMTAAAFTAAAWLLAIAWPACAPC